MHVLAGSKRQDSNSLYMTGYHFNAACVAQLTSLGWSRLSNLRILVDKLDTATASCIITGSWPVLQFLQLETDRWDFAATRILTDHQWPSLCGLNLKLGTQFMTFEFGLGVDDMPQLHRLYMRDMRPDGVSMSELAAAYHACLGTLALHGVEFAVPMPSGLMQRPWLRFVQLDLHNIILRTNDMALLVQALLPCLSHLILLNTGMCTNTLQLLVTGNWPHLKHLDLSHNRINDTAMSHLAEGTWPKLEEVQLEANQVTPLGIACLTKATWLALLKMFVDREAVCVDNLDAAARWQVLEQEYRIWVDTRCLEGQATEASEWCSVMLEHV